ncbi:MAG: BTAD domain-containing putative transcriptional regulator [Pseudomonadota bacterium]
MNKLLPRIAKVCRPRISRIVHRERLFSLLDKRLENQFLWISAAAGSGKTTLVADFLDHKTLPCIWYTIDAGDTDLASFFFYLREACNQYSPEARSKLPLLSPEYMMGLVVFARGFFERMLQLIPAPLIIVLDNYQEADCSSLFNDVVLTLLKALLPGFRLIILSRKEPPAHFSRIRCKGENILRWSDICFTFDETKKLLELKENKIIPADITHLLHDKTEGWAAGVTLLIEWAMSTQSDYKALEKETPEEIFEYFAYEIFKNENQTTQIFLLKSALLPVMTIEQAKRHTGLPTAKSILATLSRKLFFIERTISTEVRYSYHPLFRDFLLNEAEKQFGYEELQSLRRQGGLLLQNDGQIENAVKLFLEGKEWDSLVSLLTQNAQQIIAQGRCVTLLFWLQAIPEKLREELPWILYWLGVCTLYVNPPESKAFFQRAFAIFCDEEDNCGSLLAWSGLVNSTFFSFDNFLVLDGLIVWLERKIEEQSSIPSREIEVTVATSMIIALIHRRPGSKRLQEWEDKIISRPLGEVDLQLCLPAFPFFAYYYLSVGDFDKCEVMIREMERVIHSNSASPLLILTFKLMSSLMNTTSPSLSSKGIEVVEEALSLAQTSGIHILDTLLLATGVHNALNNIASNEAKKYLLQMEQVLPKGGSGNIGYFYFLSAWYHLFSGDKFTALAHARTSTKLAEQVGLVFPRFFCQILLSLACNENGDVLEARKQLALSHDIAVKVPGSIMDYIYNLLSAYYSFSGDDEKNGLDHLTHAMQLGRARGFFTMVNFWVPSIWQELCDRALTYNIEVDYIRNLVRKLQLKPTNKIYINENWPWFVEITTFGGLAVIKDGKEVEFKGKSPHKILQLLRVVIALGSKGISAETVTNILWPDADGDRARKSLEISLYRLRNLIREDKLIRHRDGLLSLTDETCRVDALVFEQMVQHTSEQRLGEITNEKSLEILEKAVALYEGTFLKEISDSWVLSYRQLLQKKFCSSVSKLADIYQSQNQPNKAIALLEESIEKEGASSQLYLKLMNSYLIQGRRNEAVATYELCRNSLKILHDSEPSTEITSLYKRLLN